VPTRILSLCAEYGVPVIADAAEPMGPTHRLLADGHDGGNCWFTTLVVEPGQAGWCAGDLAKHLAERDIETRPVWRPMHLQPVLTGVRRLVNVNSERIFATGVILPSGSSLDDAQAGRVLSEIDGFLAVR
jgi:dTDP-4-amino-4,6-dideoxygalactose transaminase